MNSRNALPFLLLASAALLAYQKLQEPGRLDGAGGKQLDQSWRSSRAIGQFTVQGADRPSKRAYREGGLVLGSNYPNSWDEMDSEKKRQLLEKMSDWNDIE